VCRQQNKAKTSEYVSTRYVCFVRRGRQARLAFIIAVPLALVRDKRPKRIGRHDERTVYDVITHGRLSIRRIAIGRGRGTRRIGRNHHARVTAAPIVFAILLERPADYVREDGNALGRVIVKYRTVLPRRS